MGRRQYWQQSVAVLLALGLSACQMGQTRSVETPPPLPQDDQIQVFMNQNPAASYTDPYRQETRAGDDLEAVIIDAIAQAQSTLDVAVQELRLPGIAAALIERHQAGVKVRVIIENTYATPQSQLIQQPPAEMDARDRHGLAEAQRLIDTNQDGQLSPAEIATRDALVMLQQAGIPLIDDTADGSAGSGLMHHKFVIIDQRTLIVTSANFTLSGIHGDFKPAASRGNANNLLRLTSPELAAHFTQEFNFMWGDGPGGQPDSRFGVQKPFRPARLVKIGDTLVQVQFSPTSRDRAWQYSTNGFIGRTLGKATERIWLALFVFSDQQLVNRLEPLPPKGVEIRTLIDPGFAFRSYSEALDMLGIAISNKDCQFEAGNRPWTNPIFTVGVPRLPPGDKLHHKFGVMDGRVVIMGSHNWTDAANTNNDETLLVIYNPTVAAHYEREFERLYQPAILGIPPAVQKKADAARRCPTATRSQPTAQPKALTPAQRRTAANRTPAPRQAQPKARSRPTAPTGTRINLNTASVEELTTLPGIGPKLASRIVQHRQKQPFRSLQDLDQVPGVGPKLLQKLEPRVTW